MVGPDRLRFDFSHYEAVTAGADRRDRDAGQRGDAAEHADTDLRDHQGRGRSARCDRLLRRQVRRHRARARGRVVDRAVRWHPRACHRRHRHDQDRQRIVDRLEPAPHRGRDRRGQRGAAATRRAADRRCGPPGRQPGRGPRSAACNAGSTRSRRSTTRSRGCAASWRWAAPPNSRRSPTTVCVVTQVDGLAPGDLRDLAIAVRQQPGMRLVVIIGETTTGGVALVAAVTPGRPLRHRP